MAFYGQWSETTRGFAVAVAATTAALVLRLSMLWFVGEAAPYLPFVLAVLVSAWYGGLWPGLLATGLGAILGYCFSGELPGASGWSAPMLLTGFSSICISASIACEALHVALRRLVKNQRELQLAQDALREADRLKNEFLVILAHELRNPLAPISNGIELLGLLEDDPHEKEEIRRMMGRQVKLLVRLVDDLLDVNRVSTGKLNLRFDCVPLTEVVQSAVESVRPFIDSLGHKLSVSLPESPIALEADFTRLVQIIANLLNNAAKYSDLNGQIWLTAKLDGDVIISVKDAGIGIAANDLHHIFHTFSQVHSARGRSHGGLGIGLSLVQGLVELHGGRVEVHSDGEGHGAEFIVRLPLKQGPRGEHAARSTSAGKLFFTDNHRDSSGTGTQPRPTARPSAASQPAQS